MRMHALIAVAATLVLVGQAGAAEPPWGPETPPFNLEVILRDVSEGSGFGHVKFRQPNDSDKIIYLNTWVRGLMPNHAYQLQRAVDTTLDGICNSTGAAWLPLGKGLTPQTITTDERGSGRELLFRDLSAVRTGTQFDIHFQLVDAGTGVPALASDCYRFTVTQ
jgi:hypothetical protein